MLQITSLGIPLSISSLQTVPTKHITLQQINSPNNSISPTANMVAESAEFKKAVEDSRSLSQTPTNDELLEVRTSQSHARHHPIHS